MARTSPHFSRPLIDCDAQHDLLASWPVADSVRASDTAHCLLEDLGGFWTLQGADLDGRGWSVDADMGVITVDNGGLTPQAIARSRHFQNILTLRTMAALRAAWQAERADDALSLHRVDLWPLISRIMAADLAVMTLRMAYELREEGFDGQWRHALGDECGDMAADYARTITRTPKNQGDAVALGSAFLQWFEKDARVRACDFETLAAMDADLCDLTMDGRGMLGEGAIRCLTIDPVTNISYLGAIAAEIAGNPTWRGIADPVAEAHFAQVMEEIGTTRVGHVAMRDAKLAARLFPGLGLPDLLADAPNLCIK